MEEDDIKQLHEQFKLVCRKCSSENVVISVTPPVSYGGQTGWQSGDIAIGCNDCKTNDLHITL